MVHTVHMNNFYETSLQISDPKIEFLAKTLFSKKNAMSKVSDNAFFFGQKKAPAGCPDSKTKVVNIFRNIPDLNYI